MTSTPTTDQPPLETPAERSMAASPVSPKFTSADPRPMEGCSDVGDSGLSAFDDEALIELFPVASELPVLPPRVVDDPRYDTEGIPDRRAPTEPNQQPRWRGLLLPPRPDGTTAADDVDSENGADDLGHRQRSANPFAVESEHFSSRQLLLHERSLNATSRTQRRSVEAWLASLPAAASEPGAELDAATNLPHPPRGLLSSEFPQNVKEDVPAPGQGLQ
eukprot:CAMPEP_0174883084 /NCGR_PEP_ID=MMETSP1114-20130205/85089_1 /TAXON_ID=312471 /ORGANISM="Neobodo designis, Strain CCAP 1951/1" /LENGTH=218 /DNA_ID=CAMNT_0016118487 /DNA_START=42 /DNA_END=699 /DNA_ORIENTATION=+